MSNLNPAASPAQSPRADGASPWYQATCPDCDCITRINIDDPFISPSADIVCFCGRKMDLSEFDIPRFSKAPTKPGIVFYFVTCPRCGKQTDITDPNFHPDFGIRCECGLMQSGDDVVKWGRKQPPTANAEAVDYVCTNPDGVCDLNCCKCPYFVPESETVSMEPSEPELVTETAGQVEAGVTKEPDWMPVIEYLICEDCEHVQKLPEGINIENISPDANCEWCSGRVWGLTAGEFALSKMFGNLDEQAAAKEPEELFMTCENRYGTCESDRCRCFPGFYPESDFTGEPETDPCISPPQFVDVAFCQQEINHPYQTMHHFRTWDDVDREITRLVSDFRIYKLWDIFAWRFVGSAHWFDELCYIPQNMWVEVRWGCINV
jgi:hypothetical protein